MAARRPGRPQLSSLCSACPPPSAARGRGGEIFGKMTIVKPTNHGLLKGIFFKMPDAMAFNVVGERYKGLGGIECPIRASLQPRRASSLSPALLAMWSAAVPS